MSSDDSSNSLLESDPQSGENTPSKLRSTEKPFSSLISTATISSIVTLVQIPYLISRVLSVGPAKFFGQKERTARPECLNDPTLGQHTFVKLKVLHHFFLDSVDSQQMKLNILNNLFNYFFFILFMHEDYPL